MYFVFFLMIVNSILEVISIGALLPLSIMMDNQLNVSIVSKIFTLENLNIRLDIFNCHSALSVYFINTYSIFIL